MKLHFKAFLIGIFVSNFLFAQENQKEKPVFLSYPELKIYGGIPFGIGTNLLSEAHDPQFDFGFYISPFSLYEVKFGIGFDYSWFKVSDASLAGNGTHTNMALVYGYFSYPLKITNKIDFEPKIGIGGGSIQQKRSDENFGRMDCFTFNFGANLEYELAHPLEVFAGTDYFYSKINVNTPADYKSFFGNLSKMNVFVGVKFNFRQRKNQEIED